MSDLFAKKTDSKPGGTPDKKLDKSARRQARTQEQKKAQKKTKIISITVLSVFLLLFISAMILNSSFIRRSISVINIGGVDFTAAEIDYYYNVTSMNYRQNIENQAPELASMLLPSPNIPLTEQEHPDTGESWRDFFVSNAIAHLEELVQIHNAAKETGFKLSEEDYSSIDSEIDFIRVQAPAMGYTSIDQFLRFNYGPSMNVDIYRKVLEFTTLASVYQASIAPEADFTQEELAEYYRENKDSLDVYEFRLFAVYPDEVLDWEYETDEEYEEALAGAFEASVSLAAEIAAEILTEEDFITRALIHDFENYGDPDSTIIKAYGEWLSEPLREWLSDPARSNGDVDILADEDSQLTYILFFMDRDDNHYPLASIRQVSVGRDAVYQEDYEDDDELSFLIAYEGADSRARAQAEDILSSFMDNGANEAALEMIAAEEAAENVDGSLIENISRFPYEAMHSEFNTVLMPPELEEWIFDPARQVGNYELIRSEDYGFRLIYFTGFGDNMFSDFIASDRLLAEKTEMAYEQWRDNLQPVTVKKGMFFNMLTNLS